MFSCTLKFGLVLGLAVSLLAAPARGIEAPRLTPEQIALLEKFATLKDRVEVFANTDPALVAMLGGSILMMTALGSVRWTLGKFISARQAANSAEQIGVARRVGEQIDREWGRRAQALIKKLRPAGLEADAAADKLNAHVSHMPAQLAADLGTGELTVDRLLRMPLRHNPAAAHLSPERLGWLNWVATFQELHKDYEQKLETFLSQANPEIKQLEKLSGMMQNIALEGHAIVPVENANGVDAPKASSRFWPRINSHPPVYETDVVTPQFSLEEHRESKRLPEQFGRISYTNESGAVKILSKPSEAINELKGASTWCVNNLHKLKLHESRLSNTAQTDTWLGRSTLGLAGAGAALYGIGHWNLRNRLGTNAEAILAQSKADSRGKEIQQIMKEQQYELLPTTLSGKLYKRRTEEKDPELVELYRIMRDLLRTNLSALSSQLKSKGTSEQLSKAEFYSRFGKFHNDDEFADGILDSLLAEVALSPAFKVSDAEQVEQLMWATGLVRPERTERFLMLSFGSFSQHLWPKYGVKSEDYELKDPTVIQKLVDSYLKEIGAVATRWDKAREEKEKAKVDTQKPAGGITQTPLSSAPKAESFVTNP